MEIKIRQSDNQTRDSDLVKIDAKLSTTDDDSIENCLWSFKSANPDVTLHHSKDAPEERFLNYGTTNPVIEVKVPDNNIHEVIVMARILAMVEREVEITTLGEDNILSKTTEVRQVIDTTDLESLPISIKIQSNQEGWV